MNTIGIICEYNPFHNGHVYHIQKIKEMFPDSLIILVLNGYFLERGDLAILSKEAKTKIALQNNIDLVVELPFVYGSQSADTFANASLQILNYLKVEYLVFGSESNDINTLEKLCNYMIENEDIYNKNVKRYLKEGINYPTSLARALNTNFKFNSNDLLGISYIKAIKECHYPIKPLTIKRTSDFLDTVSCEDVISAQNIREKLQNGDDIQKYLPEESKKNIENISLEDLYPYLKYKIMTEKDLSIYLDVDEGIEKRIKKVIDEADSFKMLMELIKTKRYTYNKIRRMLIHILIGFTKEDKMKINMDYIKVLGFNQKGQTYLSQIKKDIPIPLTPIKTSLVYQYELMVAHIYDLVSKSSATLFEVSGKPIKMKF